MSDARYDIAVIGAGLAGLTTANTLRHRKVLILEAAPCAGGRVLTKKHGDLTYELGAIFASHVPPADQDLCSLQRKDESPTIALYCDGRMLFADGVAGCLNQLPLEPAEQAALRRCMPQPAASVSELSPRLQTVLNAFFHLIHPGDIWDYRPERKNDATHKFDAAHYLNGNGELLQHILEQSRARLLTGAVVTSVKQDSDRVQVEYSHQGEQQRLQVQAAIITTPAPITKALVRSDNPHTLAFLANVRFVGGVSVALGMDHCLLPEFAYLVTPDLPVASVIQQRYECDQQTVLLICYGGAEAEQLSKLTNSAIVDQTLAHLRQMGLDVPARKQLRFYDLQKWRYIAPLIDAAYDHWNRLALHPEQGIFLAGDYTAFDLSNGMPYGMNAAIASGQRAAVDVQRLLADRSSSGRFQRRYLVEVTRYHLDRKRPVYGGTCEEGDIALYGIVLQAEPTNGPLKEYLLSSACDGLWEWQANFGTTLDDSALVMEGLLAAGVPAETLRPSVDKLVALFFEESAGAFCTLARSAQDQGHDNHGLAKGRAAYWRGPTVDATAHAIWLLHKIAPKTYVSQIRAGLDYIGRAQAASGCWHSRWFPSVIWPTWLATRALALDGKVFAAQLQRSRTFLNHSQMHDGSWNHRVVDTSLALLTMSYLSPGQLELQQPSRQWLLRKRLRDGTWPAGEAVLYYWYELENGDRIFHHCTDKGDVATAWARLALEFTRPESAPAVDFGV